MTAALNESIVTAEQLRNRAGGRSWNEEQTADATRILVEAEGDVVTALGAPISPLPARTETAPVLGGGLVCPRWPVHTVTSINGAAVDDDHPLDPAEWRLEQGYLFYTGPSLRGTYISSGFQDFAYVASEVVLGYQPGWGDIPAIRSMITRIALARVINSHDDTMVARDLQAEAPPAVREPTPEEIRERLSLWRWLQVRR